MKRLFQPKNISTKKKFFSFGFSTALHHAEDQQQPSTGPSLLSLEALRDLRLMLATKPISWLQSFTADDGLQALHKILSNFFAIYFSTNKKDLLSMDQIQNRNALSLEIVAIFRAYLNNTVKGSIIIFLLHLFF
jgi:hypothetical protein